MSQGHRNQFLKTDWNCRFRMIYENWMRQADRQTPRQTIRQRDKQTGRQAIRQAGRPSDPGKATPDKHVNSGMKKIYQHRRLIKCIGPWNKRPKLYDAAAPWRHMWMGCTPCMVPWQFVIFQQFQHNKILSSVLCAASYCLSQRERKGRRGGSCLRLAGCQLWTGLGLGLQQCRVSHFSLHFWLRTVECSIRLHPELWQHFQREQTWLEY